MNIKQEIILIILLLFSQISGYSKESIFEVLKFEQSNYQAARQNWSVSSAGNGDIFFANHTGLLQFNGTNWILKSLPGQTIFRAVNAGSDSLIYSSGYMELGFWKTDVYGQLSYVSLTPKAQKYFINNIEFWNIALKDDFVYYQSFSKILAYHNDSIVPITFSGTINVMSQVNNRILVAVANQGIFEIERDSATLIVYDDLLMNDQVKFLLPFKENQVLIGMEDNGIYLWDGEKMSQWNKKWTRYFIDNEINRGYVTRDNKIIIGSLIDGIVVFDFSGNLLMKVNTQNGLPNNTVLGIATDEWNNIWLALDNGAALVSISRKPSYMIEDVPGTGAIYSVAKQDNMLYLGTNQGLFANTTDNDLNIVTLIPNTQGQIWDCQIFDGNLYVGHNQGTFLVKGTNAKLISDKSGGFSLRRDPLNENMLIQCTYNNLITFKKNGDFYKYNGEIEGFGDLIRYIEIDHVGNIWASHMHRGIYKIVTDDKRTMVLDSTYYGKETFGKDNSIHVFKVENRIVFTNNDSIYTYDDLNFSIIPYTALNKTIGKYKKSHRIVEAPDHHYWFISDNYIGLFYIFQDEIKLIKEYPASLFNSHQMIDNYENILPLTATKAILCLQNGIAYLDAEIGDSLKIIQNYKPVIRQVELHTDDGKRRLLPLNSNYIEIKNNFHNIYFGFSFPRINSVPVKYQYILKGLNSQWSEKLDSPELEFERLAKGEYTLEVKAVDLWENESEIYKFSFEVLPPWYISDLAVVIYFLIFVVLLWLFRTWGIRQTQKREKEQNEKRERELIRLRNEKLRSEVEHKSKELANSTMSIIKKNEFLLDLKNIINKQKAELGSRYPDKYYNYLNRKIEENITNQDDWQVFETNFERAHEQFLMKIKESYPDLTPGDLRLCAYLRMNLSSKEIAPLLGISVRGVENHRYRLRKKLNIAHDEGLADIILSF